MLHPFRTLRARDGVVVQVNESFKEPHAVFFRVSMVKIGVGGAGEREKEEGG